MKERKIINVESVSVGKRAEKNEDSMYIGKNFVAVIDGVAHKSEIKINGKITNISEIITEAIKKIDRLNAPVYAKTLEFEEFVKYINLYIKKYLSQNGFTELVGKLEATGVIYSRYYNQIWLVGDCKAIYDGKAVENPLEVDRLYIDIRRKIIEALLHNGYTEEQLMNKDISKEIIANPEKITDYIKNPEDIKQIQLFREERIKRALSECGFSEEEIKADNLIQKYYNPRDLQSYVKNNPNVNEFGYAIFNGIYTETKNCKVVNLPSDVTEIKLFSDGFLVEDLKEGAGYAIRHKRSMAKEDPLSIKDNAETHSATIYSAKAPILSIDDASAVIIRIKEAKQLEREESERR